MKSPCHNKEMREGLRKDPRFVKKKIDVCECPTCLTWYNYWGNKVGVPINPKALKEAT